MNQKPQGAISHLLRLGLISLPMETNTVS